MIASQHFMYQKPNKETAGKIMKKIHGHKTNGKTLHAQIFVYNSGRTRLAGPVFTVRLT